MKSFSASVRDDCGPDRVDQAVRLLDDERRRYGTVEIERVWARCRNSPASVSTGSTDFLADLVKADLRRRFDLGESPRVADYLVRFPELSGAKNRLVSLIYEEYCLQEEQGAAPDVASFCDRYADWKDSLFSQLEYHRLFSQATGKPIVPPRFPHQGDDFEEFHLVSLLGEGGASRVFLARDLSLGGKHVVLKVAIDRGEEPKLQGRLDHPHIVPVNSVAFAPERGLVGMSMPLQPGLPLDVIIARLDPGSRPTRARAIWQVLVDGAAQGLIPSTSGEFGAMLRDEISRVGPRGDRWAGFPVNKGYAQGVAWIVMTLAKALQYAHSMATFHRDVKPGNVLLTLAHGPQLLDFNLAESPHSADRAHDAFRGGTLPYMAPEQIQAFLNPDLWGAVGAAADVYSLGLVLREMLTGLAPEAPSPNLKPPRAMADLLDRRSTIDVSVRRSNPTIPHALEAIVAKALAFDPADRYPDALALAVDLECFVNRKPLVHAAHDSRPEKLVNWAVRRRWSLVVLNCLTLTLALALYRPIAEYCNPTLESLPAFQAAVAAVEHGDKSALVALLKLEDDYPHSCLVKLYLTIALDALERTWDAESRFRAALDQSDVETVLLPWASLHPDFAIRLEEFAASRYDLAYLDDVDDSTANARIPFTRMAREGLLVAESLNPGSPKIQRRLARAETLLEDYPSALARLSASIEQIETDSAHNHELNVDLYFSRLMRAWSITAYVDHARAKGLMNPNSAYQLLSRAQTDLEFCTRFMDNWVFENKPLKEYYLMREILRVMLSLGEVELSVNRVAEAERHINRARSTLVRFTERARSLDRPRADTVKISDRVENDLKKIQTLGAARSSPPSRAPASSPNA